MFAVALALATSVVLTIGPRIARSAPASQRYKALAVIHRQRKPIGVVCQPLFVCDIVLDSGESILAMATGDSARWILSTVMSGPEAQTPHVLVKPTDYGLRTDLIIATGQRVCYLLLLSTRRDYQGTPRLYYPVAEYGLITRSGDSPSDQLQFNLARLDFAYRLRGEPSFMPTRVLNDGAHTYIEMPSGIEDMPVVFAIANDGSDAVVNYRFRHGMFVVDGVPQRLALVQGSGRSQRRVIIERGN
jgi:P-type conjugative transfer protein TrbG